MFEMIIALPRLLRETSCRYGSCVQIKLDIWQQPITMGEARLVHWYTKAQLLTDMLALVQGKAAKPDLTRLATELLTFKIYPEGCGACLLVLAFVRRDGQDAVHLDMLRSYHSVFKTTQRWYW